MNGRHVVQITRLGIVVVCTALLYVAQFGSTEPLDGVPNLVSFENDEFVGRNEYSEMEDEPELEQDYVQLESLDYEVVNRRDDFTLAGSGTKFSQLPDCTDEEPIAEAGQNHVLVSTLDGDITSLDLETGAVLWRNSLGHQRLLSTSSAGLQMVAAGKMIQLVPSLDGMLYQISKGSDKLTALPVSADALKASTFKFDDETYVSGGYSSESFGLYAGSGALVYKCDHEGCKQRTNLDGVIPPLSDSDDVILVTKTMRNVYAFDPTLGIEKFNYSVGEHQVELVRSSGCRATAGRKAPSDNPTLPLLRFSLSDRLIQAELEDGTRLWKNRFDHPITGAWRLQDGELTKLDLLAPSNLYQLVPLHSTTPRVDDFVSPDVYLGRVGQQMYVQHSERLRMKLQAFSAANTLRRTNLFKIDGQLFERPSISWKPYFVRPPQLAHALPHDNGKTSLAIQYHPDASSIDAAAGVDVAGANGHNQQSSATVTDITDQDLNSVTIPDDTNIVAPDNNNRSNFGVYLFMNDALFDDGRPPIRRAIDSSAPGLKYGAHDPPTAARDATSPQADSPWAWVVSWFNHSLSLTWQLRFPVSIVQSVLLCVCLLFTIQVFSPAWSKWLVTFLLAPLIALYAAFRKLWPTVRQAPQAGQASNLPYTSLAQTYNCTAAPSEDVFQVTASQNFGQPQPQPQTGQGISSEPSGALFPYNRTIRHQQWPSVCPVADSQADHQTTANDGRLSKYFPPLNSATNASPVINSDSRVVEESPRTPENICGQGSKASPLMSIVLPPPNDSTPKGPSNTPCVTPPTYLPQQSVSSTESNRGDASLSPRSRIDDFEIRSVLGWGGFGVVFKAYVSLDDNEYAVKRIPLPNKERNKERVLREVRVLAKLNHNNIVRYNGCWTETHSPEYIEKFDLQWKQKMDKKEFLSSYQSPEVYTKSPTDTNLMSGDQPSAHVASPSDDVVSGNPLARGRFNVPHSKDSKNQSSKIGNESSFTVDFDEGSSGIIFADSSKPELEEDGSFHNHVSESNDSGGNSHSFTFNQESSFIQSKDDSQLDEDFNYNSEKMDNDSSSSGSSEASCEDVAAENNGLTSAGSQSDSILFKDSTRPGFSEIIENGHHASNIGEEDGNDAIARPDSLNLSDSVPSLSQARYAKRSRKNSRGPQDYLYIQMELCDPKTLKDWLMQNTERPKTKVLKFFLDIVNAVEHVHDKQMMHRDLKPSNIFFSLHQEDVLKVGDLGLVTHIADEDSDGHSARTPLSPSGQDDSALPSMPQAHHKHTQGAGTQTYMSPEQLRRVEYDYKVDIFSMGLIFFEMLWPMRTDSERIRVLAQVRMLQFPEGFVEEHPEEHDLLQLMLNADPQKRPTTRGIRARAPLKQMQLPHELEAIKENEHFQLIKKHRRNTSSASSHDVAEALAAAAS